MSKHKNFSEGYGRGLNAVAIGVSGGTIVVVAFMKSSKKCFVF